MKNRFFLILLILTGTTLNAFKDKPALNDYEWGLFNAALATGAVGGAVGGWGLGGGTAVVSKLYLDKNYPNFSKTIGYKVPFAVTAGFSGPVGLFTGLTATHTAGMYALSKWHKVSRQVEEVSRIYNINIDQYRPLLIAAETKNKVALRAAVNAIYPERFGNNWHTRLKQFFSDPTNIDQLFRIKDSMLNQDEQDYFRMMQLGAAMAKLYFDRPTKGVNWAIQMYKKLGLL